MESPVFATRITRIHTLRRFPYRCIVTEEYPRHQRAQKHCIRHNQDVLFCSPFKVPERFARTCLYFFSCFFIQVTKSRDVKIQVNVQAHLLRLFCGGTCPVGRTASFNKDSSGQAPRYYQELASLAHMRWPSRAVLTFFTSSLLARRNKNCGHSGKVG